LATLGRKEEMREKKDISYDQIRTWEVNNKTCRDTTEFTGDFATWGMPIAEV